jgi:hypothetical protein
MKKLKKRYAIAALCVTALIVAVLTVCSTDTGGGGDPVPDPVPDLPDPVPVPANRAEHLAMLKKLGVDIDPDLPVAPNGQPYNPQASSGARAAEGEEVGLGPLGNVFSRPRREIFTAGYDFGGGKNHALYEDFTSRSALTILGQDSANDSDWAARDVNHVRKSVAADLNGDGIDEVVVVTLNRITNKILVYKGEYKNNNFTVTQAREADAPATIDAMLPTGGSNLDFIGWSLVAADLNGDDKQECILTIPEVKNAHIYILDNDLKISEIDIQQYVSNLISGTHWYYFPMVTAADYDQDGKDEIFFMIGVDADNFNAPYVVLDDKDAGYRELAQGNVNTTSARLKIGNLAAGDFTGDGLPDTAFYGYSSNNSDKPLLLLKTAMDSSFKPVFEWVASGNKVLSTGGHLIPRLATGDVDGDGKTDLYAANKLWTFNTSANQFEQMAVTGEIFSPNNNFDIYHTVIGDVTGDQKDDVVFFHGNGIQIYYYSGGQYQRFIQSLSGYYETGCLPNVDDDSLILRDTGRRELLFTDPHVIAVLASPPYYSGINGDGDGGTSFGYSKSSGTSSSNSFGFSVGVSAGYESDAFFGLFGAEFETTVTTNCSWAQSSSVEISESWGWNNPIAQDLVVFTAIPFDVYYYEVLRAPADGDVKAGDPLTVNVPRKPKPYHTPLPTYNAGVPEEHRIEVNHTLGVPSSYYTPADRDQQKSAAKGKGLFSTNTQMSAGMGTGSTTINIESVAEREDAFAFDLEVEVSAAVKAGGVKVGASAGFSYGYETTSSVSEGTYIEGTVPAIPVADYESDMDFVWGLMAYPKQDNNQNYIFVTYWADF